jgi:hypothetical protein
VGSRPLREVYGYEPEWGALGPGLCDDLRGLLVTPAEAS